MNKSPEVTDSPVKRLSPQCSYLLDGKLQQVFFHPDFVASSLIFDSPGHPCADLWLPLTPMDGLLPGVLYFPAPHSSAHIPGSPLPGSASSVLAFVIVASSAACLLTPPASLGDSIQACGFCYHLNTGCSPWPDPQTQCLPTPLLGCLRSSSNWTCPKQNTSSSFTNWLSPLPSPETGEFFSASS